MFPASLEDLIAFVVEDGWIVNNLFQRNACVWQCNLRSSDDVYFTDFGLGGSPYEAMLNAYLKVDSAQMKRAEDAEKVRMPAKAWEGPDSGTLVPVETPIGVDGLLTLMGLPAPKPFVRRV